MQIYVDLNILLNYLDMFILFCIHISDESGILIIIIINNTYEAMNIYVFD